MTDAANLAGWVLKNTDDGHEAKFIQKVVEQISLELRSINFRSDENLVGMETRINGVLSSLGTGFDDVRVIGIKGMGGGGKTTLARAVFDQISFQFEGKSFVEKFREVSKASPSVLNSLQNQILSDVFNDKGMRVSSVHEGIGMMKRRMPSKKILLVLDDVDHKEQLKALAGETTWFKPGSIIIITTRDRQVLESYEAKSIHDVQLLSHEDAMCLFSRYAFGKVIPNQGYKELSKQVVCYASGLPLAIEVLGSFLCGKDEVEWMDALLRLKTIPSQEILEILEISYIGLENDYKEIFLNVACLLKGWSKANAIKALESCGFHARNGLRVLEQKSLITVNDDGYLGMHDHIEEMGRNIVRRLHPDKPKKHSRLWINSEIEDILANKLGTQATRYIKFYMEKFSPDMVMKGLRKMKELTFLHVSLQFIDASKSDYSRQNWKSKNFPNALRYLCWNDYPYRSLPKKFQADSLVALEMVKSQIVQLWGGGERKALNKLKFLDLSYSKLRNLDLGLTPNIEMLNLRGCRELVKLHMLARCSKLINIDLSSSMLRTIDLGPAPNLEILNLKGCEELVELHMLPGCLKLITVDLSWSMLRTLDLRSTPNLELLDLKGCSELIELHMPDKSPNLRSLELSYSKLRTLDIGLTPKLEYLEITYCYDLEELHMADECQKLTSLSITRSKFRNLDLGLTPSLKTLDLKHCYDFEELHMTSECRKLTFLNISHSKLRSLDLKLTPNLETLDLKHCYDFEELHMTSECRKLTFLNISHSKLRNLDLKLTPNLETLDLKECSNLVELQMDDEYLKNLVYLDLSGSLRFLEFKFDIKNDTLSENDSYCSKGDASGSEDESLEVGPLAELLLIMLSVDECPFHPDNNLPKFQLICCYKEDQRLLTSNLETLISVGLCVCTNLDTFSRSICGLQRIRKLKLQGGIPEVPKDLDQLECLEKLEFSYTNIKHLPDNICMLKHLQYLKVYSCSFLEKLPENLGQLECLRKLSLSSTKIKHLPDSICILKHLESLELCDCSLLERLPEDIGRLECLKHLSLCYCIQLLNLPEELVRLECLKMLDLTHTFICHLPQSIFLLKGLRIVGSRELLQSCDLRSEIQPSIYDEFFYMDV
ncbi:unnamed protein product [Lactuca saligna]|uniref:NB-ARC domain-containing protein n=1 Tax=Lactuca saligna TaxID=75948 RepID=A0AA36E6X2_LACSI|nr:unnamed protein product [Lactuca saligna]